MKNKISILLRQIEKECSPKGRKLLDELTDCLLKELDEISAKLLGVSDEELNDYIKNNS